MALMTRHVRHMAIPYQASATSANEHMYMYVAKKSMIAYHAYWQMWARSPRKAKEEHSARKKNRRRRRNEMSR